MHSSEDLPPKWTQLGAFVAFLLSSQSAYRLSWLVLQSSQQISTLGRRVSNDQPLHPSQAQIHRPFADSKNHVRGPVRCETGGGWPLSDEVGEGPQKVTTWQDEAHLPRLARAKGRVACRAFPHFADGNCPMAASIYKNTCLGRVRMKIRSSMRKGHAEEEEEAQLVMMVKMKKKMMMIMMLMLMLVMLMMLMMLIIYADVADVR